MQNWTRRDSFVLRDKVEGPNGTECLGWLLYSLATPGLQGSDQTMAAEAHTWASWSHD